MSKKILIVDDEWALRELLRIRLSKRGFDVVSACSAEECRELAFRENPDLLILDIWLGEKESGTVLYDQMLSEGFNHDIPVIFVSALVDRGTPPKHAPEGGKYALYGKPFDFDQLFGEIDNLLKISSE